VKHHIYFVLARQYALPQLLLDRPEALRRSFQLLASPSVLTSFSMRGFIRPLPSEDLSDGHTRRSRTQAPFIPAIGPLVLSRSNLPHHVDLKWLHEVFKWWGRVPQENYFDASYAELDDPRPSDQRTFVDLNRRNDLDSEDYREFGLRTDFAGRDESVWHVPLSVEAKSAILPVWPNTVTRRPLNTPRPRLHIHVFPYGMCTVFICVPIVWRGGFPLAELIVFLRQVGGIRVAPSQRVGYKLVGHNASLPAMEFADVLARRVARAIIPSSRPTEIHCVGQFHVVSARDLDVTIGREIRGLLSLDEHFADFSPEFSSAASLYGKRADDLVVASSGGLFIRTPRQTGWARSSGSARRRELRHTWRLIQIMELARNQKSLFPLIERRITKLLDTPTAVHDPTRDVHRLLRVAEHLATFHRGFPAHHRKWYYKCQQVLGLEDVVPGFDIELRNMVRDLETNRLLKEAVQVERVRIEVGPQAQVGTINLGQIAGNIENTLNQMQDPNAESLRTALKSIAEAIVNDEQIDPKSKAELLESVEFLSESAVQQPEERRSGILKRVIAGLSEGMATAAAAGQVWSTWAPVVGRYFGLP
jgi:hypothetical protein